MVTVKLNLIMQPESDSLLLYTVHAVTDRVNQ